MIGIVKWFDEKKGFGFIVAENKDHFVHYKSIIAEGFKTIHEKDKVEFDQVKRERGLQAENVRVIYS